MDDHCVVTHSVCVSSFVKKEDDLQIDEYIKKTASLVLAGGNREVIYFLAPRRQTWIHSFPFLCCLRNCWNCSVCLASFILYHFTSNGLTFTVTEAKRISEKINPLKMGFHQGFSVWCCVTSKNNDTQRPWCKAPEIRNRWYHPVTTVSDLRFRPSLCHLLAVKYIFCSIDIDATYKQWPLLHLFSDTWSQQLTHFLSFFFFFFTSSVFCTCVSGFNVQP